MVSSLPFKINYIGETYALFSAGRVSPTRLQRTNLNAVEVTNESAFASHRRKCKARTNLRKTSRLLLPSKKQNRSPKQPKQSLLEQNQSPKELTRQRIDLKPILGKSQTNKERNCAIASTRRDKKSWLRCVLSYAKSRKVFKPLAIFATKPTSSKRTKILHSSS